MLAAAAGAFVVPEAALAAACPVNRVCFYGAQNYGGSQEYYHATDISIPGCVNLIYNNAMTSYSNYTDYTYYAYDARNCSGIPMFKMFPNRSVPNVGSLWNDKMSSVQFWN